MSGRRTSWLIPAVLLLCAGLATGWATYLWWLPCRGVMLVGTALETGREGDIPAECYVRMDQGVPYDGRIADAPMLVYHLSALALLTAALAWLLVVVGPPWGRAERRCMLPLAIALGLAALRTWLPALGDRLSLTATLLIVDVAILLAASVLVNRAMRGDRVVRRAWIPLLAVGALGLAARAFEYMVMAGWSQLNWDVPPGTGYLRAGVLVIAAIAMALIAVRDARTSSDAAEDRGQRTSSEIGSLPA